MISDVLVPFSASPTLHCGVHRLVFLFLPRTRCLLVYTAHVLQPIQTLSAQTTASRILLLFFAFRGKHGLRYSFNCSDVMVLNIQWICPSRWLSEPLRGYYGKQGHLRGDKRELGWNLIKTFKNLNEGSFMFRWLIWEEGGIQFTWRCLIPTWGPPQPWCSWADLSTPQLQGTSCCRAGSNPHFFQDRFSTKTLQVCKQWKEVVDSRRLYKQLAKKICSRKVNIGFTRSAFQKQLRDVRRGRFKKKKNKSWFPSRIAFLNKHKHGLH